MSEPAAAQPDLTWPALLAHWTAFAQASLALPKNAEGERWRDAVPAIIGLQAIGHALGEVDRIGAEGGPAAALDLAAVGIHKHAGLLRELWQGEPLHEELATMIDDARAALAAAKNGCEGGDSRAGGRGFTGLEWIVASDRLVVEHPAELIEALLADGFDGDLYLPVPGTVLFKTSPAGFISERNGVEISSEATAAVADFLGRKHVSPAHRAATMRQVYRQFDFGAGCVVRDLVRAVDKGEAPPPGQPQLVAAVLSGRAQNVTLPIPGMANQKPVPVAIE